MGFGRGIKTAGMFFRSSQRRFQARLRAALAWGFDLQVLVEVEGFGVISAGSPTPADRAPATDNWKPSKSKPCAPSPGSVRRSSAVSYGSSIPALPPVLFLAGPAAASR